MSKARVLVVGDMHAVPDELEDCSKLAQFIIETAEKEEIKEVWFTGDQHHTHAVVRLEVMHWWKVCFKALKQRGLKVVCLVGNHDQASPGSSVHAMMAYDGILVVDTPAVRHGVLMLPYMHTQDEFVAACRKHGPSLDEHDDPVEGLPTVFCHQTFDGSTYENGFLASDGFDPNLIPQELIVSGHIHSGQEFGKVWYVGAPRWRTLTDANTERAIWALTFEGGHLTSRTPYSTGEVCRQIKHVDDTPENPVQLPLDLRHQWRVDIRGSADWCQARKTELAASGARVRTFPTQVSTLGKVRESDGIGRAFKSYMEAYQPKYGTEMVVLQSMAVARL